MFVFQFVERQKAPELHCAVTKLEARRLWSWSDRLSGWQDELALMSFIRSHIQHHVPPPVQLGVRRASLAHKFQAALHVLFLLCGSLEGCAQLLQSIPAWISDYGTEIAVARVRRALVKDCFPYFKHATDEVAGQMEVDFAAPDEADFAADDAKPPGSTLAFDASTALEVPGILHVLHNAGRHLESALKNFSDAVTRLAAVTRLLSRKESKLRIYERLFQDSPAKQVLWKPFQSFQLEVHIERWGTVASVLLALDDQMLASLRYVWNVQRLTGDQD